MSSPLFDLEGKVALVTGGNGGIGLGMAEALAQAGADVCIWGRNEDKNRTAEEKLKNYGRRVLALKCDVTDETQVDAGLART
ncbi:MAG: SDR family NAD(P)-dependent oxidoreductase, partial [Pseudomonadota bacterium]